MLRAFAITLLASLALAGCKPAPPAEPQLSGAPALWTVQRNDGAVAGWLFGTIHALPPDSEWWTPALESAAGQAGVLVVEVRDLDPTAIGKVFERLAKGCPCPPVASRLPASARPQYARLLAANDLSARQYDGLETWAAALALAQAGAETRAQAANGADRALISHFEGRPVAELEGAGAQLAIFDALPEAAQRRLLAEVVTGTAKAATDPERLARAWLRADLDLLDQETRQGFLADPALYDALLKRRNLAWLERLDPLLADGRRPFVAVGAAHLLGPDGLIALLETRGYRVERVL